MAINVIKANLDNNFKNNDIAVLYNSIQKICLICLECTVIVC